MINETREKVNLLFRLSVFLLYFKQSIALRTRSNWTASCEPVALPAKHLERLCGHCD